MRYLVLKSFSDLQDNRRIYKAGDMFPRDGYNPSEERIAELASDKNKRGVALIMAIEPVEPETPPAEPEPQVVAPEPQDEPQVAEAESKPVKEKKKEK